MLSAVATATIGAISGILTVGAESQTQLEIQRLAAQAERDRLEIQQKFEIIVQATKGLPPETASENLLFFVKAGILPDPEGRIEALAEEGFAPELPEPRAAAPGNPLLDRLRGLDAAGETPEAAAGGFVVENGILLGVGGREVKHLPTPNFSEANDPAYVIVNFTASLGRGAEAFLTSPEARASAHGIIYRDGSVTQLLPFDFAGWHAGSSRWGSLRGLNRRSIGLELENWGRLSGGPGGWKSWTGAAVPDGEVVVAAHRNLGEKAGWHLYTAPQIATLKEVLRAILAADPGIVDILGNDDIAPGRKLDPGPAFPMAELRRDLLGRAEPLPPPE